jgi:PhzF family phenazine biosynthesis protein
VREKTLRIPAYHVDVFAGEIFSGNPAMVCPLDRWLDDTTLQLIAAENNLPATAFFVEKEEHYELRWFSPTVELDLCGHGTVAAAAVLFETMEPAKEPIVFKTKGEIVHVVWDGPHISIDFPVLEAVPCAAKPEDLVRALGREPKEILKAPKNYLAVYSLLMAARTLCRVVASKRAASLRARLVHSARRLTWSP